jgi:hypothetical protein
MAIAFDAAANNASVSGPTSPTTFTHTCGSLTNGAVLVGVAFWQNVAGTGTVTGITYGGNAMTVVGTPQNTGAMYSALYRLIAPAAGANTVSITYSGALLTATAGAMSFSGVDQTTPVEASNAAVGFSLTATVSTTTLTDNAWVVHAMTHFGTEASTIGQGSSTWNLSANSITGSGGYVGPKTPAGAQTTSWTWATNSRDWAISTGVLKPASAVTAVSNLALLGVG